MTSMIHLKTYNPVVYQTLRVTTELYGIQCSIYNPENLAEGFKNYSDIIYSSDPLLHTKLLIPRAILGVKNANNYGMMYFDEEPNILYSTHEIPQYSKIIVNEQVKLSSFIVTEIEVFKDARFKGSYFKYTLTNSSSINQSSVGLLDTIVESEIEFENDGLFSPSIDEVTVDSEEIPSATIKSNKL